MLEWCGTTKGDGLQDQKQPSFFRNFVPGVPTLSLSFCLHFVLLALIVVLRHFAPVQVSPKKYEVVQMTSGSAHISLSAKATQSSAHPARMNRRPRRAQVVEAASTLQGSGGQSLREQAQRETAAITMSLKFHGIYGFYPGPEYKLAVQKSGEIPVISADQVPLHFQQYVVIEVTIDTEGKVAEARVVAGIVDTAIENKLLSAIRDFKYTPARRDGVPIPSQRDIVIHVPS